MVRDCVMTMSGEYFVCGSWCTHCTVICRRFCFYRYFVVLLLLLVTHLFTFLFFILCTSSRTILILHTRYFNSHFRGKSRLADCPVMLSLHSSYPSHEHHRRTDYVPTWYFGLYPAHLHWLPIQGVLKQHFVQAGCPSCRTTNIVKALKALIRSE